MSGDPNTTQTSDPSDVKVLDLLGFPQIVSGRLFFFFILQAKYFRCFSATKEDVLPLVRIHLSLLVFRNVCVIIASEYV